MKKIAFTLLTIIIYISACRKDNSLITAPPATANFSVNADSADGAILLGTYDQVALINNSTNATTYQWDFGNDSISNMENPVLWYPKSGTYTLKLTAINKDGVKSTYSRKVKVLDRVLKQIVVNGETNYNSANTHTLNNNSQIWAVIKLGNNNTTYSFPQSVNQAVNQSLNAPVLFQTQSYNTGNISFPLTINIPNKIIIDFPALAVLSRNNLGYKGVGYGLELYGQDNIGTYLLSSSYQIFFMAQSSSVTWPVADIKQNLFKIRYGNIDLICDYE